MSSSDLPSRMSIFFTSVAPLCLAYLGPVIIRAELHEWVNIIVLTLLYPLTIWYLTKNTVFADISYQGITMSLVAAILIIVMILRIEPDNIIVKRITKYFKEYGRKPFDTFAASTIVATSICIGSLLTLAWGGREGFLDLEEF